jgi:hypothetical protein
LQADDVRRAPAPAAAAAPEKAPTPAKAAPSPTAASKPDHAVYRTFNNLEIEVTGLVEGEHHYLALVTRSTGKESQAEADAINQRAQGWQFDIPSYKYQPLFRPLEELLKKIEPPKPKAGKAPPEKKPPT